MEKEEKTKGPYLQAFNYDIEKGKELTLGDIFEADDEFFDIIENWRMKSMEFLLGTGRIKPV